MASLKDLITKLNVAGIPIPLFRDPKTRQASISFTLVVISALNVQISLVNLFAQIFKGIDVANSLYWFGMCSALYFGRSVVSGKDKQTIDAEEKK